MTTGHRRLHGRQSALLATISSRPTGIDLLLLAQKYTEVTWRNAEGGGVVILLCLLNIIGIRESASVAFSRLCTDPLSSRPAAMASVFESQPLAEPRECVRTSHETSGHF